MKIFGDILNLYKSHKVEQSLEEKIAYVSENKIWDKVWIDTHDEGVSLNLEN